LCSEHRPDAGAAVSSGSRRTLTRLGWCRRTGSGRGCSSSWKCSRTSISSLNFLTRLSYILKKKETALAEKNLRELDIKASSLNQQVQFLSGGNQQKVILSRWLSSRKKILLMDEPTRGVDVMAKSEIYKLMGRLAEQQISILFSSSDVTEVLGISDRLATMRNGRIVRIYSRDEFDKEKVLHDILFDQRM
jgi:ABC-type sugar transport system ATPase subunit